MTMTENEIQQRALSLLPPNELRKPGFGDWSSSVNGYSRFLEAAIHQCKEAALRCAENGLDEECKIFLERASELENILLQQEKKRSNNGE